MQKENKSTDVLVLRDQAKDQLQKIKTVEQGITYLNKLKSIETWVQAEKKDAELQNIIAEQKLRTQRLLGELIEEGQRKGIIATSQLNGGGIQSAVIADDSRKNLDAFGLTKQQSSTFKQIASIPPAQFEEFIQERKKAVNEAVAELTTAGAVRLAKSLQENHKPHEQPSFIPQLTEDTTPEDQVKELADWININFSKEQKASLITMIYPN